MKLHKLTLYVLPILGIFLNSCEDDSVVGNSIQPEEDLLSSYHNHLNIETKSVVTDSILSKADYLLFGRYSDALFGEIYAEYSTQLDARIGGVILPDTTIVTNSSATSGILETLLNDIDGKFGKITAINNARNYTVDSTLYIMQYNTGFWGDSTALQAVQVYELNNAMDKPKYYTNVLPSEFCDQSILLGETNYQIKNSREIRVPVSNKTGERISSFYKDKLGDSQQDFNDFFKGVYVKHAFNEGTMLQVDVSGILVYYHYDADIHTVVNGKDTMITSENLKAQYGINPLVTSFFLSGNKSIKRANSIQHTEWDKTVQKIQSEDSIQTYMYTPSGVYTEITIPFEAIMDSVKRNVKDTSKMMFNSVRLILHRKSLDNKYKYNGQMLLIDKDSLENFFYNNQTPNGISSFTCSLDTKHNYYAFNITRPTQNMMNHSEETYSKEMVVVPVTRTMNDNNYSYKQQIWMTGTALYGTAAPDSLKPCLDIIYTQRN